MIFDDKAVDLVALASHSASFLRRSPRGAQNRQDLTYNSFPFDD